jgi:hypothetical protein
LDVAVHDQVDSSSGETVQHDGKHMIEQSHKPHSNQEAKKRKEETSTPDSGQDLRSATKSYFLKVPPPPNSTKLGDELLTHGSLGYISDSNCSRA